MVAIKKSNPDKQQERIVYHPLGRGRIVHDFPDGSVAVEFDYGGGKVLFPEELSQAPHPRLVGFRDLLSI